jgi:alpha-methylacyl-CoA racemase
MIDDTVSDSPRTTSGETGGALAGMRIVEFAGIGPAPFAAMLLADMGADILRIDRPGGGDMFSRYVVTRGRRTIVADLKDPGQVKDVIALLENADALIEGFRPGVMERLGLGPDVILKRNRRLVYGRMTGWGQTGPLARAAGHDLNYIAITGALAAIGPKAHPVLPLNLVGDCGGGSLYLIMGLLAGIISARRTGLGQVVDCAICDGAASLMAMFTDLAHQGRWTDERQANLLDGGAPFYRTFMCADGKHVSVGPLEPQFYALMCARAGLELAAFDRDDVADWPALHVKLEAVFRTRTRDEWCDIFAGSDACVAPVLTLSEAPNHPHLKARETFVAIDEVMQPAPAPRFSRTPSRIRPKPQELLSLDDALSTWPARPSQTQ